MLLLMSFNRSKNSLYGSNVLFTDVVAGIILLILASIFSMSKSLSFNTSSLI